MKPRDLLEMTMAVVKLDRIKIIACKKCNKGFTKRKDYKLHKMKHDLKSMPEERIEKYRSFYGRNPSYEKKFQCDHCHLRFVSKDSVKLHSVLHYPFPNICDCGVGFYKKKDLESHMKMVHNKEIKKHIEKITDGVKKKFKSESD
ncbi:PREDICTED: gastrula zinc finger protein XlCGF8.2DB-like [Papilio polytes]|uniref:gastrula zinc finger protein XlCGF8.2DB-like n=1 Tax=Papilio polytes TaxID=76194 RepID=UPI000676448B|nr:PREDICTED: gastrula zinc finger protein XlCGF8.2DB-like [Papilio polytes]